MRNRLGYAEYLMLEKHLQNIENIYIFDQSIGYAEHLMLDLRPKGTICSEKERKTTKIHMFEKSIGIRRVPDVRQTLKKTIKNTFFLKNRLGYAKHFMLDLYT